MWGLLLFYGLVLPFILLLLCGYDWRWVWKLRHIPGPKLRKPFTGNIESGYNEYAHYTYLLKWPKIYGPVFRMFLAQVPYVVVTDPVLIEQICTRQFAKFHDRNPLPFGARVTDEDKEQFESNIFWATGKQWSAVRSACEPLFHSSSLESYGKDMHDSLDQWLALMDKLGKGGKGVNVIDPINGLTMSILGKATFGVDFDCQSEKPVRLVKEAFFQMDPPKGLEQTRVLLMALPMLIPLLKGFFTYLYRWGIMVGKSGRDCLFTFAESEGYVNGTTRALIRNARRGGADPEGKPAVEEPKPSKDLPAYRYYQLKGQANAAAMYKDRVPSAGSFVPRLVEAKIKVPGQEPRSLNDAQIVAQAYSMILAGYDSPASTMSHCLYKLAMNPGVQARLIQEVDSLGPGARPTYKDLARLPYTEATFQETLRFYPAGNPMYSPCRKCTKDTVLGGYKIPAGVAIMLNSTGYSQDAKYFPDPTAFKPERHIPGTPDIGPETRPPTAHMPFGYGPHGCLGRKFAIEQAVFLLVRFLQRYTITLDEAHHPPGQQLWVRTSITFQPDHRGLWVKLHPRSTASQNEE